MQSATDVSGSSSDQKTTSDEINFHNATSQAEIDTLKAQSKETGINPKDLIGAKKVPLGLIPPHALNELALALADGAKKYDPFNWRETPVQAVTYLEAGMGHILAVVDGSDLDEYSKVHHLGHAMACCAIYLDAFRTGNLVDNRYTIGKNGKGLYSRNPDNTLSHLIRQREEEAK